MPRVSNSIPAKSLLLQFYKHRPMHNKVSLLIIYILHSNIPFSLPNRNKHCIMRIHYYVVQLGERRFPTNRRVSVRVGRQEYSDKQIPPRALLQWALFIYTILITHAVSQYISARHRVLFNIIYSTILFVLKKKKKIRNIHAQFRYTRNIILG